MLNLTVTKKEGVIKHKTPNGQNKNIATKVSFKDNKFEDRIVRGRSHGMYVENTEDIENFDIHEKVLDRLNPNFYVRKLVPLMSIYRID